MEDPSGAKFEGEDGTCGRGPPRAALQGPPSPGSPKCSLSTSHPWSAADTPAIRLFLKYMRWAPACRPLPSLFPLPGRPLPHHCGRPPTPAPTMDTPSLRSLFIPPPFFEPFSSGCFPRACETGTRWVLGWYWANELGEALPSLPPAHPSEAHPGFTSPSPEQAASSPVSVRLGSRKNVWAKGMSIFRPHGPHRRSPTAHSKVGSR